MDASILFSKRAETVSKSYVNTFDQLACDIRANRQLSIYSIDQVFDDPQVKHLEMAKSIDTSPFGKTELVSQPFKLSRTPSEFKQRPPEKGEHTEEILFDLGIRSEELKDLIARKII